MGKYVAHHQLGEDRSLGVQETDEGVIIDAFLGGELVGTIGRTFEEWWEAITE